LKSKATVRFVFLADSLDASQLPAWVQNSSQTTDGHLIALAQGHAGNLATFDSGIPGAELIP
jgi:hypothetical protein